MNLNINDLRIDPAYAARRSERYEPLTTAVGQSPCDGCAHYQRRRPPHHPACAEQGALPPNHGDRMIILGLTGPAGCGKTTAARHLVGHHGFRELSFAEPIRALLASVMGMPQPVLDEHLQDREWKERPHEILCGRSPRHAMQTLGTEWGRNCIHPDFWVRRAEHCIAYAAAQGVSRIVISDVRFPNEAALVRRLGTLMHIERADIAAVAAHSSESGIAPECGDAFITNTDIPALCRELDNWVLSETGGEPE